MDGNIIQDTGDLLSDSAHEFWTTIAEYLPNILGAFLLLLAGGLIAAMLARLTKRILKFLGADKLNKNKSYSAFMKQSGISASPVEILAGVIKWTTLIIFAIAAVDILGLTALRDLFRDLLAYVPSLLAAAIIIAATVAGSRIARDFVTASLKSVNFDKASLVASIAQGFIVAFGAIVAMAQLGFDTTLLTANVTLIIGAILFTGVLAFGIGGRDTAANLLAGMQVRSIYNVGDTFNGEKVSGKIESINMVSIVVKTERGNMVVPHNTILKAT